MQVHLLAEIKQQRQKGAVKQGTVQRDDGTKSDTNLANKTSSRLRGEIKDVLFSHIICLCYVFGSFHFTSCRTPHLLSSVPPLLHQPPLCFPLMETKPRFSHSNTWKRSREPEVMRTSAVSICIALPFW